MDGSINLTAWLGCNVKQAFEMFVKAEHLQSWLPAVSNEKPKIGGKFEIFWTLHPDDESNSDTETTSVTTITTTNKTKRKNKSKPKRQAAIETQTRAQAKLRNNQLVHGYRISGYEQDKFIALELESSEDDPLMNPQHIQTKITIYFLPITSSKKKNKQFTEVHLTLTGWTEVGDVDNAKLIAGSRTWFESLWASAFEKLIEHVNEIY